MKCLDKIDISDKKKLLDSVSANPHRYTQWISDQNETILHQCKSCTGLMVILFLSSGLRKGALKFQCNLGKY